MANSAIFEGVVYKRTLIDERSMERGHYGWSYIGKTAHPIVRDKSWDNAGNKSYGGKKINEARELYGVSSASWKYKVLERVTASSKEELIKKLKELETKYIREFDSVENGFNSSYGDGNKGVKFDAERRAKIGAQSRGRCHSEATKQKISEKLKGKEVTEDTRAKISAANTGKKRTPEMNKAQSDRMKGTEPTAATKGAEAWREKHGGGYWKGKKIPNTANMKIAQQERGTKTRAYFPDGHSEDYNTMLDASKATGVPVGSIHYSISHGSMTRSGFRFETV